jgi:hypothetical protein
VIWWSGIIEECLRNGWIGEHRLVLRVDDALLERFENAEGSRPKGLGGVVVSLMRYCLTAAILTAGLDDGAAGKVTPVTQLLIVAYTHT